MAEGAGAEKGSAVQAGISAQPLVTNPADIINPSATAALSQAMRQGFLTADDIIQRIGPVGQAKDKADVQMLTEAVSPEQIAARRAQAEAAVSGAQLNKAQAEAALPNVSDAGNLQSLQLHQAQADMIDKDSESAWRMYHKPILNADGSPNHAEMQRRGYPYRILTQQLIQTQDALSSGKPTEFFDPKTNQKQTLIFGPGGDVTPGSQGFQQWQKQRLQLQFEINKLARQDAKDLTTATHPEPGEYVAPHISTPTSKISDVVIQPASAPAPVTPDVTARPEGSALNDVFVAPNVGNVTPVTLEPGQGIPGPLPETETDPAVRKQKQDIHEAIVKDPRYIGLAQSEGPFRQLIEQEHFLNQFDKDRQNTLGGPRLAVADIELASNFIKLYDPTAVVREFKWDKLENGQALADKMHSFVANTLARQGKFTPEQRQEILRASYSSWRAKQQSVQDQLKLGLFQAKRNQERSDKLRLGQDWSPETIFDKNDIDLAAGNITPSYDPPKWYKDEVAKQSSTKGLGDSIADFFTGGKPAPASTPNIITLPSGRKGYLDANGQFHDST